MVGSLPCVCVHLQQHAVSGNVTFIPGLVCVCRVMSVFPLPHPPSRPRRVPSSSHRPGREPSQRHLALHDDTGVTEERGPRWRTSISTFHTLLHNMSAWLYLGCFFTTSGFVLTFFSSSKYRKWKIWLADSSLGNTLLFQMLGKEILAFRCHEGSRFVEKIYQFAMFVFSVYMHYRYTPSQKVSVT